MLKQFLKAGLCIQCKRTSLARQTNLYNVNCKSIRNASSKTDDDNDDLDKPIQYSRSPAATWRAAESRDPSIDRHPQESNIVAISLTVFMLYFFVLREENDIDLIFDTELKDRFPNINLEQRSPISQSK